MLHPLRPAPPRRRRSVLSYFRPRSISCTSSILTISLEVANPFANEALHDDGGFGDDAEDARPFPGRIQRLQARSGAELFGWRALFA